MNDRDYMALAIELARKTVGQTSPNPSVGCVVVKEGIIVGLGSHLVPGEGHAEVLALTQAGAKAKQADVYVTLEPCSYTGKTPPCADLLIASAVKRVIVASVDPNPKVSGEGITRLRNAGIQVEVGLLEAEAKQLNHTFFHFMKHKRPYVTLKAAMTLDGKIATKTGDSKWITSELARRDVHNERARHDAIIVGRGTVIHDNPQLTVRYPENGRNPIRIVLATDLDLPDDLHVFDTAVKTYVVCGQNAPVEAFTLKHPDIGVIQAPTPTVEIPFLLDQLSALNIQSVYVEGGSTVHASFIEGKHIDQVHMYIAPKLLTGKDAVSVVGGSSPTWMNDAVDLTFETIEQLGDDLKIVAKPKREVI
ncbi:diaminohydroxyphosphoribosylaminopyrimidine deaminase /5-amino-6-(5-phosphoribosylamino)uracil reductase [Streptohalobacillus salinus]|uniref:Riboflavin biosynthesis protein RibD n=1 Tax=Streptohalobacillus salinus TaxID=621096 RepID=A0A2V3W4E1_9BACI|nr:bifunctional diaminohydroxyphosphoribosylaminopyrimidine deaminase/5-amino-6-(5-phosphoribosylamino)uracil reductase RibD [Streptohalobacillus salinus]PXW89203.1 diaminohydroxyphosphoribosylaminopyrimidine deaminase /5-amino-6-(5-phosphoribosylamino)uracil reductase [Streptohalobacillus salinus]